MPAHLVIVHLAVKARAAMIALGVAGAVIRLNVFDMSLIWEQAS